MKQQTENRKYYEAYDERYKQIHSTSCKIVSFTTLERELEGNGLSIVEKGITSIEPGFPVIMYALVKKK